MTRTAEGTQGMARSLEENLARLRGIESAPRSKDGLNELRRVLKLKNSFAVARAAGIVGENEIEELTPELGKAFARFIDEPEKSDKGRKAKEAIAEALYPEVPQ